VIDRVVYLKRNCKRLEAISFVGCYLCVRRMRGGGGNVVSTFDVRSFNERRGKNDDPMKVRLCFYEPRGENEHWMNRLVAWAGKHYVSHVEILFEDDYAASIFADETVFFKKRTYANPYYRIKMITVSPTKYWLMYNHAKSCAERQIGFSTTKMFCGPLIGYNGSEETFCSEFVTQTLQVGGVDFAMKMDANRSTPSVLLDHMNLHETVCFDSTAFKLGQAFR
jgi:hypothetical protein